MKRDWGWIGFMAFLAACILVTYGFGGYVIAGSPGWETRQESRERHDREIKDLQRRVAELEKQ